MIEDGRGKEEEEDNWRKEMRQKEGKKMSKR